MKATNDPAFVLRVLSVFAEFELHDDLHWRTDGEYAPITFFVNCNDVFAWACADAEDIESHEDLDEIERAARDCQSLDPVIGTIYATMLWACRKRKRRPQKPAYPEDFPQLWPLLDAVEP